MNFVSKCDHVVSGNFESKTVKLIRNELSVTMNVRKNFCCFLMLLSATYTGHLLKFSNERIYITFLLTVTRISEIPKIIAGVTGTLKKDKDFSPYICYYLNLNYYIY